MIVKEEILLNKIIYSINSFLSPKRILLFGSRGKGIERTGSDFDIAIDCDKIETNIVGTELKLLKLITNKKKIWKIIEL